MANAETKQVPGEQTLLDYWRNVFPEDTIFEGSDGTIYRQTPSHSVTHTSPGPKPNNEWETIATRNIQCGEDVQIDIDLPPEGETGRGYKILQALRGENYRATFPCGCIFEVKDGSDFHTSCNDEGPSPCSFTED